MSSIMSLNWALWINSLPRSMKKSFKSGTKWIHPLTNFLSRWPAPNSVKSRRLSDQFNLKTKINGSWTKLNTTLRFWRTSWRHFRWERAPSQQTTECSTISPWNTSASKIQLTWWALKICYKPSSKWWPTCLFNELYIIFLININLESFKIT